MKSLPLKQVFTVVLGVAAAGLLMHYGKNLPVIRDARDGFN